MTPIYFRPNKHSRSRIYWRPLKGDEAKKIRDILAKNYNLGLIKSICQVKAWETLSNNYKIVTSNGRHFLFRRHIQHRYSGCLDKIDKVLTRLKGLGLPVPNFIRTLAEKDYVKDGDEIWQLFEFIPGSYFKGTNKEMIAAGLVIANLHMALRKISPRGLPAMFPRITFKKWQIFLDRLNKEGFEIKDTQIGQALQKNESCLIEQKKVIIHSDLHPHNILSFSGEKLSIIDFGNLSIDDERLDLASAAHRLSRQFVVYNTKLDFRSQEELFVNGLKIFLTSYSSILKLNNDFFKELPFWMREALLRKVAQLVAWWQEGKMDKIELIKEFKKFAGLFAEINTIEKFYVKKKIK